MKTLNHLFSMKSPDINIPRSDTVRLSITSPSPSPGVITQTDKWSKYNYKEEDPLCRMYDEQAETAEHLLFDCPTIARERYAIFGNLGKSGEILQEDLNPLEGNSNNDKYGSTHITIRIEPQIQTRPMMECRREPTIKIVLHSSSLTSTEISATRLSVWQHRQITSRPGMARHRKCE
ncbi:hypothetical protein J6590_002502 [Homalodisca vitripennis]|nr:hypothetical protein J6590_002502 [Homalodisca vitripennis]